MNYKTNPIELDSYDKKDIAILWQVAFKAVVESEKKIPEMSKVNDLAKEMHKAIKETQNDIQKDRYAEAEKMTKAPF